jgi:hypothetical protein
VGYCYSFEVYQGKKRATSDQVETEDGGQDEAADDNTTGPIAMMRNVSWMKGSHRTVFCDRYYTSVWLFLRLKELGINACGTIQPNRRGFTELVKMDKSEKSSIARGSLRMAKHQIQGTDDYLCAMSWMDSKPVHLLSSGMKNSLDFVSRMLKQGNVVTLPACAPLTAYHKNMGGVDTHDYMRMSNYSLQESYHMRKWYKAMFLGLIDIAVTNSFILWKLAKPGSNLTKSDFYYAVAEGLITYEGFRTIGRRVATRGQAQTPSRAVNTASPRPTSATVNITLVNANGHSCEEYLPKTKTRNRRRVVDDQGIPRQYGYGGSKNKSRECYVCRKMGEKKRRLTQFYCNKCGVAVCHIGKLTRGVDGNMLSCWNALHSGLVELGSTSRGAVV